MSSGARRRSCTRRCRSIAHPAIRTRGTIGGSLAHADPAAELPAVMLALDAQIGVQSRQGTRQVPAIDFFTGLFSTALEPWRALTEIVDSRRARSRHSARLGVPGVLATARRLCAGRRGRVDRDRRPRPMCGRSHRAPERRRSARARDRSRPRARGRDAVGGGPSGPQPTTAASATSIRQPTSTRRAVIAGSWRPC